MRMRTVKGYIVSFIGVFIVFMLVWLLQSPNELSGPTLGFWTVISLISAAIVAAAIWATAPRDTTSFS